ncbi:hypothetical protein F5880DRAFT_1546750 [Lentinula raphanica]|nr:hypothetical protein F5880DRAFT_1546750 [Lentinula raphanica]
MVDLSHSVLELPPPLLILIHLQILQYPHVNNENLDIHIFDAQKRGLRARTKMMEDLGYWLVAKLEGKHVKKILPTYPCIKPSDTIAFRTSFANFLDTLRHSSMKDNTMAAGFWRHVQARKSYLEECSGKRFLQLFLSFSTHVLFKLQASIIQTEMPLDLYYPVRLDFALLSQRQWVEAALNVLRRQQGLADAKARLLASTNLNIRSRYRSLPTSRLVALRDSRLADLLALDVWKGDSARRSLDFFIGLAGFSSDKIGEGTTEGNSSSLVRSRSQIEHTVLPVAAARHPSYIRELQKPVFQLAEAAFARRIKILKSAQEDPTLSYDQSPVFSNAVNALHECREDEEQVHAKLASALKSVQIGTRKLQGRLNELKESRDARLSDIGTVAMEKRITSNLRSTDQPPGKMAKNEVCLAVSSFCDDERIIETERALSHLEFETRSTRNANRGKLVPLCFDIPESISRVLRREPL